jgi:hypothetical protein
MQMQTARPLLALVMAAAAPSARTPAGRNATYGAAAGTVLGGAAGTVIGRTPQGVIAGATIDAVSGAIIAANNTKPPGWCVYRDRNTGTVLLRTLPVTDGGERENSPTALSSGIRRVSLESGGSRRFSGGGQ